MADDEILINQQVQQAIDVRVTDLEAVNFGNLKTGAVGLVEAHATLVQREIDNRAAIDEVRQKQELIIERIKGVIIGLSFLAVIAAGWLVIQLTQVVHIAAVLP